jgi:hypothetical protein
VKAGDIITVRFTLTKLPPAQARVVAVAEHHTDVIYLDGIFEGVRGLIRRSKPAKADLLDVPAEVGIVLP